MNNQIDKVVFSKNSPAKKFTVTYHLKVKDLDKLIKDLLNFLHCDDKVEKIFLPAPVASYKSARK